MLCTLSAAAELETVCIVLEAVQQDGFALHLAAAKLLSDRDAMETMQQDSFAPLPPTQDQLRRAQDRP